MQDRVLGDWHLHRHLRIISSTQFFNSISLTSQSDLSFLSGVTFTPGVPNPLFFRPNELPALRMAVFKIISWRRPARVD